MKIVRLEIENIKHLKVVNIEPDGSIVVVGGNNAAGKSCVLDSIEYLLNGQTSIPSMPIRKGQKKARILGDFGDIEVTRVFTSTGSRLVVKDKNGKTQTSPQALLDKLIGKLTFDPLEFALMDPKKRLATLKEVVGLDFKDKDLERKRIFDERTLINTQGKQLKARLDGMECFDDAPDEEVSMAALSSEHALAVKNNSELNADTMRTKGCEDKMADLLAQRKELDRCIQILDKQIDEQRAKLVNRQLIDTDDLQKQMIDAESINKKVRVMKERSAVESQLQPLRKKSQNLTRALQNIDEFKTKTLAKASFPIDGLTFDEDEVSFNGIPFDQCSTAEQIKISVSMGLAMNPELRILLIRQGSLLDENNLAMIAEMADDFDAQIWLERVSKGSECQVIIEDGSVKEQFQEST